MTANTPLGFPYPEVTDRVSDGWDAIRDLAVAVDAYLAGAIAAADAALDARLDALEADTGWIAPTFGTGWSNYGSGYVGAGYRKVRGVVHLRGLVKHVGPSVVGSTPVFTLPAGFRPASGTHLFLATTSGLYGQPTSEGGFETVDVSATGVRCDVTTSGVVLIDQNASSGFEAVPWVSLAPISFMTD